MLGDGERPGLFRLFRVFHRAAGAVPLSAGRLEEKKNPVNIVYEFYLSCPDGGIIYYGTETLIGIICCRPLKVVTTDKLSTKSNIILHGTRGT